PDDPRYKALPLKEAPTLDAHVAFVTAGWPVADPLGRFGLAKNAQSKALVEASYQTFGDEQTMSEASPPRILERGEKVALPPAHVYWGAKDVWTPVEFGKKFVEAYRKAGGNIEVSFFEGQPHRFVNDKWDDPDSQKAI